jgi:hypothetical protein
MVLAPEIAVFCFAIVRAPLARVDKGEANPSKNWTQAHAPPRKGSSALAAWFFVGAQLLWPQSDGPEPSVSRSATVRNPSAQRRSTLSITLRQIHEHAYGLPANGLLNRARVLQNCHEQREPQRTVSAKGRL